ncbi:MAG TPA: bifunctional ADP-dependent NAD(P)H-hydrate dehydratase/NAD(P)H-hydrate epimerase, partial [Porphyromonadaceae bacterium]|nr:bifunctional ADP-dependent NAD(P)H-hydrate dehydratase/NAD(P)H-hydrate epimerase [Porphyromonadaceae bacterium]
ISSMDLMERVATRLADEITSRWGNEFHFIIFAGPGNNGGDALALARILHVNGYVVEVYLFNPLEHLSEDCENKKRRLLNFPEIPFVEISRDFDLPVLVKDDVVIDGLFGTGLNKPLAGGYASLVQYINESNVEVVSIDIPSGLMADDNTKNITKNIIHASLTLTLQFPKLSFFFAENEQFLGEWKVVDIGLHPQALSSTPTPYDYQTLEDMKGLLRKRGKFVHKGSCGHALMIAGSRDMTGAAVLSTMSCLRSGAGLVTLHSGERVCGVIQNVFPEAIVDRDENEDFFTNIQNISRYNAIGIGPGLGQEKETLEGLKFVINTAKVPLVLDADVLNILSKEKDLLISLPENTILTPHPKEFDRLVGVVSTSGYERFCRAQDFAKEYKVIVALKGASSSILFPNGDCFFNSTGNAGMASAGMGDVLTGIITSFLAQGYSSQKAVRLGVFLHGLAGDIALEKESEESLLASDLIHCIGEVFKKISQG